MDKKKQMIEYMIQDLVEMISEEQNLDYDFAMRLLYDSELYNKLSDTETELYRESPAYVYGLFQDELSDCPFFMRGETILFILVIS